MVGHQVTVRDITGEEELYTLDSHGFQLCKHESRFHSFEDKDKINSGYFSETEDFVKHM
jgi:hypothetical protein